MLPLSVAGGGFLAFLMFLMFHLGRLGFRLSFVLSCLGLESRSLACICSSLPYSSLENIGRTKSAFVTEINVLFAEDFSRVAGYRGAIIRSVVDSGSFFFILMLGSGGIYRSAGSEKSALATDFCFVAFVLRLFISRIFPTVFLTTFFFDGTNASTSVPKGTGPCWNTR